MDDKQWAFVKNSGIASLACIAGGVAGAELADLVMETPASIALASTASQYLTWFATFIPFHVRDNLDLYYTGVHLRYGTLIKDITAMTLGCGALDVIYLSARPTLTYALQHQGFGATGASLLADIICVPAYLLASLPLVQGMGVIRTETMKP